MDELINADPSRRVVVHSGAAPWMAPPLTGLERRLLDRTGGEVARNEHRSLRAGQSLLCPRS